MLAAPDTRTRLLDTAEQLLRRYGPDKTTVVDVARALGMSHSNVYKHFPSKEALWAAVAERWLHALSEPLARIVESEGPAAPRLRRWFHALHAAKRRKVHDDPELFASYQALAEVAQAVVADHVATLEAHVAAMVEAGKARGEFRLGRVEPVARALLEATARFHHPHFVQRDPRSPKELDAVLDLLLAGLAPGA